MDSYKLNNVKHPWGRRVVSSSPSYQADQHNFEIEQHPLPKPEYLQRIPPESTPTPTQRYK